MLIKGFSINLNRCIHWSYTSTILNYVYNTILVVPQISPVSLEKFAISFAASHWELAMKLLLYKIWTFWRCMRVYFLCEQSSNLNGIENFFLLKLQNVAQYDAVCTDNVCHVQMSCVRKFRRQLHHAATLAVLTWTRWLQMFVAIPSFVVVTDIGHGTTRYVGSAAKCWLWKFSDTVTNN